MNQQKAKGSLCALLLLLGAAALPAEKLRNHFDSDAPLREPGFFDFVVLVKPGPAQWKVLADFNPPSAPNQVTQVLATRPADAIAVAVRRNSVFRDGTWSIAMKRGTGRGGILFRMTGEKDFLVLLVDLESGDARLFAYKNGKAAELAKGRAELGGLWGVLEITAAGPKVTARWAGKPLLEASDANPAAGKSGMATAGPGMASFDEFILDPYEEGKP